MKTLEDQMSFYAAYHQDARNKATHFVGVPVIVFSLMIPLGWLRAEVGGFPLSAALVVTALLLLYYLVLDVPLGLAMEKLRGFVADHAGRILSAQNDHIQLEIDTSPSRTRRASDRPMTFLLDLRMKEIREPMNPDRQPGVWQARTKIQVAIAPKRTRDRRRTDLVARSKEMLLSLRAYLMAEDDPQPDIAWEPPPQKHRKGWLAWLTRK